MCVELETGWNKRHNFNLKSQQGGTNFQIFLNIRLDWVFCEKKKKINVLDMAYYQLLVPVKFIYGSLGLYLLFPDD